MMGCESAVPCGIIGGLQLRVPLLEAQRVDGVDVRRAAGGNQVGPERSQRQQDRNRHENPGVMRADAGEERSNQTRGRHSAREAESDAHRGQRHSPAQHLAQYF